jgi:hypothetical protein
MAKERKVVMNPPAELEPRASDVPLPYDRYLELSLFAQLKAKPSLEKFPGTVAVRRFRKGEVICRQGEAGWTAFYVISTEDMLKLRQGQLQAATDRRERTAVEQEVALLEKRLAQAQGGGPTHPARAVATVHLAGSSAEPPKRARPGRATSPSTAPPTCPTTRARRRCTRASCSAS